MIALTILFSVAVGNQPRSIICTMRPRLAIIHGEARPGWIASDMHMNSAHGCGMEAGAKNLTIFVGTHGASVTSGAAEQRLQQANKADRYEARRNN